MSTSKMPSQPAGFTLIEMMITVAIIGILAAIAYPSYQESVRKGRRADAQAALVGLAAAMERDFMRTNGYSNPATFYPNNVPLEEGSTPTATARTTYRLSATIPDPPTSYTLTATINPSGPQKNDRCGNLTLASSGLQGRTGTAPIEDCWRR